MCLLKVSTFFTISVLISLLNTIKGHENNNNNNHHRICSSLVYGEQPCSFLPAPPGKTPPCALPGLTYCENIDHYPGERIQYLIRKWRFDHSTLILDETRDDFSSYFYPPPTFKYGPYGNNLGGHHDSYFPEPIYIPKPHFTFDHESGKFGPGNTYIPPSITNFTGYPDTKPAQPLQLVNYKYSSNDYIGNKQTPPPSAPPPSSTQQQAVGSQNYYSTLNYPSYNAWGQKVWGRKDNPLFYRRKKRSAKTSPKRNFEELLTNSTEVKSRKKRQSLVGDPLCPTRSQFVMPRAALNNKGNWMYVVNMPQSDNRFTQLVKSETCVSQTCSSLCGLPNGYTSRCEQKYVQKRLVALDGGGNDLYNDVFWFPSCCVCTLSNS